MVCGIAGLLLARFGAELLLARRRSPSLVPLPLALPVSFRPRGIVLKQLPPVVWMLRAPLLRALQTPLPIHRIGGDLPPVVIVTAPSLAGRVTTSSLSRLKLGWQK